MGENAGFKIRLHNGDDLVGDMNIYPQRSLPFKGGDDLRISSFSTASDRCPPLVVLHTIASEGMSFKLKPLDDCDDSSEFAIMHSACLRELKTAIIYVVGGMEIHLVAMTANTKQIPCFWGFIIAPGLYKSCLSMLNLRCLALVFDLDETLIVANTMRSFEDRIDALASKLKGDSESQKASVMASELKRYAQDRAMLRQYIEEDRVWDNVSEKFVNSQVEMVASSVGGGLPLKRPVVRLDDRNMIFTRINPNIRDTSVLVRLRPAWDELRSYLTAKGRKRFEVFVCTMAEREYALEMWRLLDPDAELINTKEMNDRVICVKSGLRKSLNNVFSGGNCHSKMAMVIDDRLKVWEDQDQPQVHVVPAFAPYYAPQAETSTPVPILCVARNVACHVRAGFFRDLDEVLSKKMADVDFDAEITTLPPPPIVSSYMIGEEETGIAVEASNENKEFPDGMTDLEVGKRLAEGVGSGSTVLPSIPLERGWKPMLPSPPMHMIVPVVPPGVFPPPPPRPLSSCIETQLSEIHDQTRVPGELVTMIRPPLMPMSNLSEPSRQASPLREEGEVPESELDPDTRRRLLILQHGQDTQYPHSFQEAVTVPVTSHLRVTIPAPAPAGGWLGAEEEMSPGDVSRTSSGLILEPESPSFRKQLSHSPHFYGSSELTGADALPLVYPEAEKQRANITMFGDRVYAESDSSSVLNRRDIQMRQNAGGSSLNPIAVLQEIAQKCNTKLEFRSIVNTTKELQFCVEVLFGGDKVGEGIGWTKKEAQHKAADNSLRFMASKFISHPGQAINVLSSGRVTNTYSSDEYAPGWNPRDTHFVPNLGHHMLNEEPPQPSIASVSEHANHLDVWRFPEDNRKQNPVSALKDYCTLEGVNVIFRDPSSGFLGPDQGYTCQVEVAGRVMGQGSGRSWEEAKHKAADEAMRSIMAASQAWGPPKRTNPPRSPPLQSNKRMRSGEPPRALQRMPSTSPQQLSPRRF